MPPLWLTGCQFGHSVFDMPLKSILELAALVLLLGTGG